MHACVRVSKGMFCCLALCMDDIHGQAAVPKRVMYACTSSFEFMHEQGRMYVFVCTHV